MRDVDRLIVEVLILPSALVDSLNYITQLSCLKCFSGFFHRIKFAFLFLKKISFICVGVLLAYMSAYHMCALPLKVRKEHYIP